MEGEKERERERGEEKESDETEEEEKESDEAEEEEEEEEEEEDEEEDAEGAALVWQENYGEDDLGLPIMHWEALSLRIAELEKQEEERKEKVKSSSALERGKVPVAWTEERERGRNRETWTEERERGRNRETWEDTEEDCNSRVSALTSRLQTQTNLQLCFINNSESEEEEEENKNNSKKAVKKGVVQVPQAPPTAKKSKSSGFKFEVRAALGALRDKLRTEQKQESPASSLSVLQIRRERSDLQTFSPKQLSALRTSLSQAIQDLSSELVGLLLSRDHLRTEQDAMLLEVQDMTSL